MLTIWVSRVDSPRRRLCRSVAFFIGSIFMLLLFGQTRVDAAPNAVTWPSIGLEPVASGFTLPIGVVSANDGTGRLFVVERGGLIYIIENGTRLETPFLDISDRISETAPPYIECGLLGLVFPPDFSESGHFFVYYISAEDLVGPDTGDPDPDDMGDSVLARFRVTDNPNVADADSEEHILLLNEPTKSHNGGHMLFGLDDYLYIATGDGGGTGDLHNNAQDPASLHGKILRIEVSATGPYTVPATNPFTETEGYRDEIWALGLRNPWRFSIDSATGDLYIADVGQNTYEEVNYVAATEIGNGGFNFGWRIMEANVCYPPHGSQSCDRTGLTTPVVTYNHDLGDCSVTGGHVYRSSKPNQAPVYLYGDFCTGRVWGLQPDGEDWVASPLEDFPFQITSFGEDSDDNSYLVDYEGTIYQIVEIITGLTAENDGPSEVNNATSFTATVTSGDAISYTWDFGDGNNDAGITTTHTYTPSGIYTATVVASNAASSMTATTTVYVGDAVVDVQDFFFDPDPVTIPSGGTVVWALREGNHSVTADDNSFEQPAGTDWEPFIQSFANVATADATIIDYHCTVHGGMAGSIMVENGPPIAGLTATNDGPKEVNEAVTFTASITDGAEIAYAWDFDDGNMGSGITATHAYTQSGIYTAAVVATNATNSLTATTTVHIIDVPSSPAPIAGLTASNDGPTEVNDPTGFTAAVTGGTGISYTWSFGDGNVGNGMTTTNTYTLTGVYTATVVATNATNSMTATTIVYVGDAVVGVQDFFFDPNPVTIPLGGTVVWVLREGNHSVTADDESFEQPAGGNWPPFVQTFATANEYPYYCTIHGRPGGIDMAGSVTVGSGLPDDESELYMPSLWGNDD